MTEAQNLLQTQTDKHQRRYGSTNHRQSHERPCYGYHGNIKPIPCDDIPPLLKNGVNGQNYLFQSRTRLNPANPSRLSCAALDNHLRPPDGSAWPSESLESQKTSAKTASKLIYN